MPKPQLTQIISVIRDPMLSDNFIMEFPNVPTGGSDETNLLVSCQQTVKPGMTINEVQVQLFGHTLVYAGNLTYSHDMQVTFVENARGSIMRTFEKWGELARNHMTQHGVPSADYWRDGKLSILDTRGDPVLIYKIVGMWPNTVPDVQFDGTNANGINHSIGFKYQYYELVGGSSQ